MKKTNKKEKRRENKSKRKDRKVREENKMKEKIKSKKKVIIIASIAVILILAVSILAIYLTKNNQEQNSAKAEKEQENRQEEKQKETEGMKEEKEQNQNNSSVIQAQENQTQRLTADNEYMTVYTDSEENKAPIPRGYVASEVVGEDKIDTGLVIYEIAKEEKDTIDWTADTNGNSFLDVQENYNQYVWVPVKNPKEMYGTDTNGKKWGKLYNFSTTGTTNNNWTESNGAMKITSTTSSEREPDVVRSEDKDSKLRTYDIGTSSMNEFKMQLEKEFNEMIASVEKYGGFYIGRYETGDLNKSIAVVVKGKGGKGKEDEITKQTWYVMYQKSKKLAGANTNVKTSMIWGSQWDRTLKWLHDSGSKTYEEIVDSKSWGNYSNSPQEEVASIKGKIQQTGSSEYWKANNIYDMAGNVWDWTMETNYTFSRVLRRGLLRRFRLKRSSLLSRRQLSDW